MMDHLAWNCPAAQTCNTINIELALLQRLLPNPATIWLWRKLGRCWMLAGFETTARFLLR